MGSCRTGLHVRRGIKSKSSSHMYIYTRNTSRRKPALIVIFVIHGASTRTVRERGPRMRARSVARKGTRLDLRGTYGATRTTVCWLQGPQRRPTTTRTLPLLPPQPPFWTWSSWYVPMSGEFGLELSILPLLHISRKTLYKTDLVRQRRMTIPMP